VTFEKDAEDALRQREELFRTLAETLPQLVWMADTQGRQEYVTQQWVEYTGMQPTGSETWEKIIHPEDRQKSDREWAHSLSAGVPYSGELRIRSKSGVYRWFQGLAEPVRDKYGSIQKWVGAFTDIHDQKTLTEKLENIVTERTKELQRSNEDLQQFAHIASHDLKEPVRKIITFANMLEVSDGDTLSERGRISLNKVHAAAERMMSMVNGVLIYSKLEATEQSMERIDIAELIGNVEADLEVIIHQKNAVIIKENLPVIVGAPILIRQLFYNLLGNALKFSKDDVPPQVIIRGEQSDRGMHKITITDNGIGFESEYAERIFKTFARLNTKDQYEGTGLGLSLCKKIVERHGGTIEAESELGQGAKFTIEIPKLTVKVDEE
jgi:PAS domain S-box-containing protein